MKHNSLALYQRKKSLNDDSIVLLPDSINLVFFTLTVNLLLIYQLVIWLKSCQSTSVSSWDVDAATTRTASSAYNISSLFVTAVDKLYTYTLNRRGPKILQCDTPRSMVRVSPGYRPHCETCGTALQKNYHSILGKRSKVRLQNSWT